MKDEQSQSEERAVAHSAAISAPSAATAERTPTSNGVRREPAPVTAPGLRDYKRNGVKIVVVTAYDYPSVALAEKAGVDCVLVGDSLGGTIFGYENTIPVTMEETLHHLRAAKRGLKHALLIADLPFGSYQAGPEDAIRSAVRLLKEGGAQAVKMEGGAPVVESVRRVVEIGIPVMGHLGLTPQSVNLFGGHRAQGRDAKAAERMLADAKALEAAGAFAIVLETIPAELAGQISRALSIPTIGIGAGAGCDGQVQVWHDLLGLSPGRKFRHVKRYAELGAEIEAALRCYAEEVRQGDFPTKEHSL